jgi:phosphate acetyltransferase
MIMEVDDTRFGERGVLFLADCGVIPDPTVEQLADIAVSTAQLAAKRLDTRPRVALLSYATKSKGGNAVIERVRAATELAHKKAEASLVDADFDGELQVDAALVPDIARRKVPHSLVAGKANVMVFPDLNSGNIGSKLIQHVARANAYGQILLGLDRPAAEISRGASAHDILGVAAIVGVQSITYKDLQEGHGMPAPGAPSP